MYDYAFRFEQDDSAPGVAVFCRDLPELNSYGDNREHALREAVDGIETVLSLYVDQRKAIPKASEPQPGEHVIRLPAVVVAKIWLWNTMVARDMRKANLRRLLGVHQSQTDRLVDFLHSSKIEQVEEALRYLGMSVPAPYQTELFYYAPHQHHRDFDVLRMWSHHFPNITTEQANEIVLNTLVTDECRPELREAMAAIVKERFRYWALGEFSCEGKSAGPGMLFKYSSMPVGLAPQAHWLEITPAQLYQCDEAIYRDLLGLPKWSEKNE